MTISNQVLDLEDSFKQLDLLYEIYKLEIQKDLLSKKLNKILKMIKNGSNSDISRKLKALKVIIDEIKRKKEILFSKLDISFHFFQISHKIKELNQYISNVNKALKKKKIDFNTNRLTKEYYQKDLKVHMENLHKLKIIAREYVIILNNKVLQIKVEEKFQKSNNLNIPNTQTHEKAELRRFIKFLNEIILENHMI